MKIFYLGLMLMVCTNCLSADLDADVDSKLEDLTAEAEAEHRAGNNRKAIERLVYAQHLVHREYGVRSERQLPILEQLTPLYREENDFVAAYMTQELAFFLFETHQQTLNPEHVQALNKLGGHYATLGYYDRGYELYRRGIKMVDKNQWDPIHKVGGLKGIASMHLMVGFPMSRGIRALRQAQRILEDSPIARPRDKALIALQLADMYIVIDAPEKGAVQYQIAWNALEEETDFRQTLFDKPQFLFPIQLDTPYLVEPNTDNFVDVEFDINELGRADGYKLDDELTWFQVFEIKRWLKFTRYRPRIIDGIPVNTSALTAEQMFTPPQS